MKYILVKEYVGKEVVIKKVRGWCHDKITYRRGKILDVAGRTLRMKSLWSGRVIHL